MSHPKTYTCKTCGIEKPFEDFPKHNTGKYGIRKHCLDCYRKQKRKQASRRRNDPKFVEKERKRAREIYRKKRLKNPRWKRFHNLSIKVRISEQKIEEWYNLQFEKQCGQCAICGKSFCGDDVIDHDHDTLELRGILCNCCNSGMGLLGDSITNCINAAKYLADAK